MSTYKNIVLYHANCLDGAIAALALLNGLDETVTVLSPVQYDRIDEDALLRGCKDKDVYIVDFSFTLEMTRHLCDVADYVVFLDHHKTAIDRFEGLSAMDVAPNLFMRLDNDLSGAQLAWDYYTTALAPLEATVDQLAEPWYVAHTGDRDLWKFELEGTREITAALYTRVNDLYQLQEMIELPREEVLAIGTVLQHVYDADTNRSVSRAYYGEVAGITVPIVNAHQHQSEIGNLLSIGQPFAAVWYISGDKVHVSLRSQKVGGTDVAAIAQQFGGGGHKNAAGFALPVSVPMEFIPDGLKH